MFIRDPERILLLGDLPIVNRFPAKFVAASAQCGRLQKGKVAFHG
jgi:hypothetical protein